MRLPCSKVYRAFRELDRFDDRACRSYLREASRRAPLANISVKAAALLLAIAMAAGGLPLGARAANRLTRGPHTSVAEMAFAAVTWGLCLLPGPIAGMYLRDRWLRGQLRHVLRQASCPACGYSLLGLTSQPGLLPDADFVICPECGERSSLSARGLTPASLLVPEAAP